MLSAARLPHVRAEACVSLHAIWERSLDCPNHVQQTKSSVKKWIIVRRTVRSMFGEQTFAQLRTGLTHTYMYIIYIYYICNTTVTRPFDDHARSCFTWLSRTSTLALRHWFRSVMVVLVRLWKLELFQLVTINSSKVRNNAFILQSGIISASGL